MAAALPAGPRVVSFGGSSSAARTSDLPPAIALALEPKVERAISLQLGDVVGGIPAGYTKPRESFDTTRRVFLKASEIEQGMANGKPTVALTTLHKQAPEIFMRPISASDALQINLPLEKVLEAFNTLHTRRDQVREAAVPQVETPFLQVTIEDTKKFGTTMEPIQTSPMPQVRIEAATAETLAAAEPEPSSQEAFSIPAPPPKGISLGVTPVEPVKPSAAPTRPPSTPTRIPFHLPPKGTGAPASERVPASSGPPVPSSSAPPTRIPFKISPPSDDLRKKTAPQSAAPASPQVEAKKDDRKISLPLKPILQLVPPFQMKGDIATLAAEARIELPFALIEPQLALGRVQIDPKLFHEAMPQEHQHVFLPDNEATPVVLPLHEVLSNLPSASLRMRDDQEEIDRGEDFETPFSVKAREDAKRLNVSAGPVEKAAIAPAPAESSEEKSPEQTPVEEVEEEFDAKAVVARASTLPGVAACAVTFADGLSLAGNLPAELAAEGLCAMAPSLLQRVGKHMLDSKLGSLTAMTLHCAQSPITFFMQGNICVAVLHNGADLTTDTRDRLANMTKKLSETYSQPEAANVHH